MKKNTVNIIEKLNQVAWHDMPIEKIEFSTDKTVKFIIKALLFSEIKQDYDKITIEFVDIINLKTDEIVLSNNSDLEIYGFDYIQKENWKCKIVLLCGISEPNLTINLTCKTINIK